MFRSWPPLNTFLAVSPPEKTFLCFIDSAGVTIFYFLILDSECLTVFRDRLIYFCLGDSHYDGYEILMIKLLAFIVVRFLFSFFFFISSGIICISRLGSLSTLGVSVLTARTAPLYPELTLIRLLIEFWNPWNWEDYKNYQKAKLTFIELMLSFSMVFLTASYTSNLSNKVSKYFYNLRTPPFWNTYLPWFSGSTFSFKICL